MTTIAIPQMGTDLFRKYMKSKYQKNIEAAGGQVQWIELEDIDKAVSQACLADGLLLPGGPDIDPELYHQELSEACGKRNPLRDACEPAILDAFLTTGKPILAICRGMQLMNIYFGGDLYQDIKDKQQCKHSDFFSRGSSIHEVQVTEDSRLHEITGALQLPVNSIHHQAVRNVGNGLIVSATSSDGFVEGIELPSHPFCVGVQWHPEHMSPKDVQQQQLFAAFMTASRREDE